MEAIYCGDDKVFIRNGQLYNKFRGVLYDFVPETNKLSSDEWSTDKAGSNISNKTNLESRVEKLEKIVDELSKQRLEELKERGRLLQEKYRLAQYTMSIIGNK